MRMCERTSKRHRTRMPTSTGTGVSTAWCHMPSLAVCCCPYRCRYRCLVAARRGQGVCGGGQRNGHVKTDAVLDSSSCTLQPRGELVSLTGAAANCRRQRAGLDRQPHQTQIYPSNNDRPQDRHPGRPAPDPPSEDPLLCGCERSGAGASPWLGFDLSVRTECMRETTLPSLLPAPSPAQPSQPGPALDRSPDRALFLRLCGSASRVEGCALKIGWAALLLAGAACQVVRLDVGACLLLLSARLPDALLSSAQPPHVNVCLPVPLGVLCWATATTFIPPGCVVSDNKLAAPKDS